MTIRGALPSYTDVQDSQPVAECFEVQDAHFLFRSLAVVEQVLEKYQPGKAVHFEFSKEEELKGATVGEVWMPRAAIPSIFLLQSVGNLLARMGEHEQREVAWKLADELPAEGLAAEDAGSARASGVYSNLISAAYECIIYLSLSACGYRGCFIKEPGCPDMCFPEHRLIVECKDLKIDWSGRDRNTSVLRRLRTRVKQGLQQLSSFLPDEVATRVLFVDLPDQARARVEEMDELTLAGLLNSGTSGAAGSRARVLFTSFPVNQHSEGTRLEFEPGGFFPVVLSEGIDIPVAELQNRIRHWLRGQQFPVEHVLARPGLPYGCS